MHLLIFTLSDKGRDKVGMLKVRCQIINKIINYNHSHVNGYWVIAIQLIQYKDLSR